MLAVARSASMSMLVLVPCVLEAIDVVPRRPNDRNGARTSSIVHQRGMQIYAAHPGICGAVDARTQKWCCTMSVVAIGWLVACSAAPGTHHLGGLVGQSTVPSSASSLVWPQPLRIAATTGATVSVNPDR